MASSNYDGNNEVVSFQATMTQLIKIENGTSNLPHDKQIEFIDALQEQLNDLLMKLRQDVSTRAHPTASVAYSSCGLSQLQDSDWEDINLHRAGSYGSGPSSFGSTSSYSAASTISVGSNSSRRRRPSSSRVTTTSSVSSASSTSVEEGPSITQFVQAIKSLWLQAEVEGDGTFCETIFYFLKNIVMTFFGGSDNSDTQGHRPSRCYDYYIPA